MVSLHIGRYERPVVYAGTVALAAGAYYLAGRIGLELAYLDGAVAALWPPAGVGLAVLFLLGLRLWPAIVIGDLLLGDFSTPLGTVLAQTVGNTVALVVAAWLLRRFTRGRGGLERVSDVLAFVACALIAAVISAAVGPLALRLGDVIAPDELGRVVRTWTLGDAAGVLVVAPMILTWASLHGLRRSQLPEGALVLALLVALTTLPPQRDVPFIVFPVLLWAAIRFGPRGAATAILVVCSITVYKTAENDGPFVRESITDSLLATQLFIATSALTSLLLAAVTAERTEAEESMRALAGEQAALRRVATLVAGAEPPSRVFEQVTKEVALLLGVPGASLARYDADPRTATVVGGWSADGRLRLPVGGTIDLEGDTVIARVLRSGRPERTEYRAPAGRSPRRCRAPATAERWRRRCSSAAGCGARSPRGPARRVAPGRRRTAPRRLRRAGRPGDRQHRRARAARRLARADRRGRRRRAAPARAQPARRRAAAARVGRDRPARDPRHARQGSGEGGRAAVGGPGAARPGARRPARARARHPPGRAHRPRARTRARVARDPRAGPGRDRRSARGAARRAGRGGRVLRRRRGDHERRQVRAGLARDRQRAPLQRTRDGHGRRRRRRRRGPHAGTGLRGLRDRLEALDGRLDVESSAASGTRISAEIPCS